MAGAVDSHAVECAKLVELGATRVRIGDFEAEFALRAPDGPGPELLAELEQLRKDNAELRKVAALNKADAAELTELRGMRKFYEEAGA